MIRASTLGIERALAVPLSLNGEMIGALSLFRKENLPFSVEQIALVETFADQAVIAIENARLLDELQKRQKEISEALDYQKATSSVLDIISRSPGDILPVMNAIHTYAL